MSRFVVDQVPDADAHAFWERAPQATVFTHPDVLSRLAPRVDWWVARKGAEAACMWPVCLVEGAGVGVPEFCYYVGPLWSGAALATPAHGWLAESSRVYEAFFECLIGRYGAVHAQLPCGLDDVRAFDWWNYHEREAPRFVISPRYTARLHGLKELDESGLVAGYRPLRRRELRKVAKAGPPTQVNDWTAVELAALYSDVMALQELSPAPGSLAKIGRLAELAAEGRGQVVAFRDTASGGLMSAVLMLQAKGVANMVLNLTAPPWRDRGIPAWTVHQAVLAARNAGADVFDFNGANSPNRGDDKHSYGAPAELFFDVRYPGVRRRHMEEQAG